MSHRKYLSIFMIFIFLLTLFSPFCIASNKIDQETFSKELSDASESDSKRLVDRISMKIYSIPFTLAKIGIPQNVISGIFKWYIYTLNEPPLFSPKPGNIDIKYLNNSYIQLGMQDDQGNWRTDYKPWPFADEEYYEFKLDIPDSIPEGAIKYYFYPNDRLYPKQGKETKIGLRIETYFPDDFEIPDQFILRANITRYQIVNNLYKNAWHRFYKPMGPFGPPVFLILLPAWFMIRHIQGIIPTTFYVDIVVREERDHLLEIVPETRKYTLAQDVMEEIPITVRNLGSHKDTFNFKVSTDNNEDIMLSAPNSVNLDPFEEKTVYISVATPRFFNDPGTLHDIKIKAYSVYEPDTKFNNTVTVVTEGIYISEGFAFSSIPILVFVFVIAYLFYLRRKRLMEELFSKPEKPWDIPEEKKHLEKLKKKNKEKYKKELEMMRDEYKSALLWYESYRDSVLRKRIRKKIKERKPKIKKEKPKKKEKAKEEKSKLKVKKTLSNLFKKEERKPEIKKERKEEKPVKKSKRSTEKERIIERIKKEQEKQKLKLGK